MNNLKRLTDFWTGTAARLGLTVTFLEPFNVRLQGPAGRSMDIHLVDRDMYGMIGDDGHHLMFGCPVALHNDLADAVMDFDYTRAYIYADVETLLLKIG